MPLYTFFPRTPEGVSTAIEAVELDADASAVQHAHVVLARHVSADHVEVWDQDRAVVAGRREQHGLRPATAVEA